MFSNHLIVLGFFTASAAPALAAQQPGATIDVAADPSAWQATDSIRFGQWQGRSAVWIDRGIASVRGADLRNGTFEVDVWTGASAGNVGLVFHVRDRNASEVIFIRPGLSESAEAVQYAPALNSLGAAWQIVHGDGANAKTAVPHDAWVHLAVQVRGDTARFFLDHAAQPTLVIPHLYLGADAGTGIGIWASAFRQGAWFANARYSIDRGTYPMPVLANPAGTIVDWQLSQAFDAASQQPGKLPPMASLTWQSVRAEWPGMVFISRYRPAPGIGAPVDHPDSVLGGRVAGSKVVYLRTTIDAPAAGMRRMQIGFSDGVVVYCNGTPLYAGMHPSGFRDLGYFEPLGDAVYLPLKAGKNEIVMAVTEFFGGWAASGRLER